MAIHPHIAMRCHQKTLRNIYALMAIDNFRAWPVKLKFVPSPWQNRHVASEEEPLDKTALEGLALVTDLNKKSSFADWHGMWISIMSRDGLLEELDHVTIHKANAAGVNKWCEARAVRDEATRRRFKSKLAYFQEKKSEESSKC